MWLCDTVAITSDGEPELLTKAHKKYEEVSYSLEVLILLWSINLIILKKIFIKDNEEEEKVPAEEEEGKINKKS